MLAAVLILTWLIADPRTPDLAAQVYRVGLFERIGFAVWDVNWYAGHHLPGYSLLFPPLGSLLGIRLVGALSVIASVALFARLTRVYGPPARWATIWFAVACVGDLWIGRLTFALGVSLALASVLALSRDRAAWAGALAALCAAASPVAGALLGLAGLSAAIAWRSPRALLLLAGPAAAVVLSLALLFPEGGFEPFPLLAFLATAAVVLAFLWALPPDQRLLRVGACVYLLACLACMIVPSPIGSNVQRYGVLLAGPLLLCVRPRPTGAAVAALIVSAVWVLWGPARETIAVAGSDAASAAYYAPVERFLATRGGPMRVEVPLTRSHWEAALLAPSVPLARGWEKQLDERFNRVLIARGLTAAAYRQWLREEAVAYVALPDLPLDPSGVHEGRLIERGLPYLREVLTTTHWRIYQVLAAAPLASGPGRLTSLAHDSFSLRANAPGAFLVRVRYTPYWTVAGGQGCVRQAPGGWTEVSTPAPGTVLVTARFSFARALGSADPCSGGASR